MLGSTNCTKCPENRPEKFDAFYLTTLARPTGRVWYSRTPLGHNVLGNIVCEMMRKADFDSHHSLRVSLAIRLFDAEVDEQLIMIIIKLMQK